MFTQRRHVTLPVRRTTMVVGILALAVAGLAGCDPKTSISPVAMPPGDRGRLVAINNAGLAVGIFDGSTFNQAFTYDANAGVTADISNIPAEGDFPNGGTFHDVSNINSHGVVVGAVSDVGSWDFGRGALFDSANGTYSAIPCDGDGVIGLMRLSDDGLVACGTSLYDTTDGQSISVPQPTGCVGTLDQVNDQVALGHCRGGTEPFFVTDLSTKATAAFGSAQGFSVVDGVNYNEARLTNGNLFVATDESVPTSFVFDVSGAAPHVVPINGHNSIPAAVYCASDSGLLAFGIPAVSAPNGGSVIVYDTQTNTVLDTFTTSLGGWPFGINDSGQAVGVDGDGQPCVAVVPAA
jgi:hypothetical protein